ncbi:hypothetical protein HBH69_102590 [Parastagonospora nodorum]|nr:hypothetical protein HBH69_102590 [Parastagonospora nodorum]
MLQRRLANYPTRPPCALSLLSLFLSLSLFSIFNLEIRRFPSAHRISTSTYFQTIKVLRRVLEIQAQSVPYARIAALMGVYPIHLKHALLKDMAMGSTGM